MSDDMPVRIKDEPGPQGYPDEEPVGTVTGESGSPEDPRGTQLTLNAPHQTLLVRMPPSSGGKGRKNVVVPAQSSIKVLKGTPQTKSPANSPQRQTFFVKPPPQGTPMPSSGAIVDQLLQSGLLKPNARVITNTGEVLKDGVKGGDEVLLYFGSQNNQPNQHSPTNKVPNSDKAGLTFVVPTCIPGKKGPGATKQVLLVHPPSTPGPTMTSILKSPAINAGATIAKTKPGLTSTPNSSPRNLPALSLLKTPPTLTPLSPIMSDSARGSPNLATPSSGNPNMVTTPNMVANPNMTNAQVLGTVESVQAQAKAAMSLIGSVNKHKESLLSSLVNMPKSTPPPKLHPIHERRGERSRGNLDQLCQIENVTSLVNGYVPEECTPNRTRNRSRNGPRNGGQADSDGNDLVVTPSEKIVNEEIQTLSSHGSIFGLMRAFYTVTVPDHKPTAYKQFFCNFCKSKTWDQQTFLDHITTHLFVCGRCSFRSFSRAEVVSHIIQKHPEDKGELPSLHAMHLENVNLQFEGNKVGEKASVSNALAGSDIGRVAKEDCLPVVVTSAEGTGREEFKDYLDKNVSLAENEVIYSSPEKDDNDDDDADDDANDDVPNEDDSTEAPPRLEVERMPTPPLKELGSITAPDVALLVKLGRDDQTNGKNGNKSPRQSQAKARMQYQCTNCDFSADSIETVKDHFVKIHSACSGRSTQSAVGYKSLPTKYYNLICPYCMVQMHDPDEIQHHLQLRHSEMLRKLVLAVRPVPTGPFTFVCSQCGASSPVKENMLGHILLEHETEHLLDALLYIYKAGVQRFIEHIRGLIRQAFNYDKFNFPDLPENTLDSVNEENEVSQGSSLISQDELEFIVLQDEAPKNNQDGTMHNRSRSPTKVKVIQHFSTMPSLTKGHVGTKRAKSQSPVPGPKTLKDLPEAEVVFLEETPPELLMDPRPHYSFNPTLKRASCKKCAFVTYGTNAQTHVREHVIGIHFRGRIWGCPYCPSLRMRRAEIIRHVVVSHAELPVKIVRRKPYEQQGGYASVVSKKTLVSSRMNSPARERLECWQCPFCPRRDSSWHTMVNHLRFVHVDREFKPIKSLRPTPRVNLEVNPELIMEVAKMRPYIFAVRVQDMSRFPLLQEVLNLEDSTEPEPSRSLMLNDAVNKHHKFGCKICDQTFSTVHEIKTHIFAHHPGEELAVRDFRASKAPKGQTETTLFMCPGCQFTTKMVKALQVHSIKYPAHFSSIATAASPLATEEASRTIGRSSEDAPSRGFKRKNTARKSTALPHVPPEKRQKTSRMCARKSTAKPHKSKKCKTENHSETDVTQQNEIEVTPPIEIKIEKDQTEENVSMSVAMETSQTDVQDSSQSQNVPSRKPQKDSNKKTPGSSKRKSKEEKTKKSDEKSDKVAEKDGSHEKRVRRSEEPLKKESPDQDESVALKESTEEPTEESKTEESPKSDSSEQKPKKEPGSSEVVAEFPTDHLSLRCSVCLAFNSTGVSPMKRHIVKKHYSMVPVAIDVVAKEAKKPQRLHICTQKGCPYVTYREWEFKGHIHSHHTEGEFGFDVSLLHDGHVIRRNLWRSMPSGEKKKKNLRSEEQKVQDKKELSDFMKRRHEFSRNRSRNSENGTPGDRRSERVTRLNSRLSVSSGDDTNETEKETSINATNDSHRDDSDCEISFKNTMSKSDGFKDETFKDETDTDSEKDSEEESDGDTSKDASSRDTPFKDTSSRDTSTRQRDMSSRDTSTRERESPSRDTPKDTSRDEKSQLMSSPQPPDPVHEPERGERSDGAGSHKKKSKKKKNSKHMKHRKSKGPIVVTDPDGKRKVVYPYQGVDSVTVRYKCSHCELMTNDLPGLRSHLQQQHFQLEQKAVDLRRKAARQRSGLYFCPTGTCKMHSYEYEKYRSHKCTHDLAGEDMLYQCKTCHLTTRDIQEMETHLEEHPAGYMLVDANNLSQDLSQGYADQSQEEGSKQTPGALLGSALFKENDFLT